MKRPPRNKASQLAQQMAQQVTLYLTLPLTPTPNPYSPGATSSDAPITRAPSLRDFSLLRCLGTGGFAEVC